VTTITINGLDGKPLTIGQDELEVMPFLKLQDLRKANEHNQEHQDLLSNYEHRAFLREWGKESPVQAMAAMVAPSLYYVDKKLPKALTGNKSRSNPSLEQLKQGTLGGLEGMGGYLTDKKDQLASAIGSAFSNPLSGLSGDTQVTQADAKTRPV